MPRLNLVTWGSAGPSLLLVHGMAAHSYWWGACGPLLAASHRAVALDLSGHGDSDWRLDGDYSAKAWAQDIERARLALGWERFALCGHSLGARVSLEYAVAFPQRLSELILIDFLPEFTGRRFARARQSPQPYYASAAEILARFRLQPQATVLDRQALAALGRRSIRKTTQGYTWKYDWRCFRYHYAPVWPLLPRVRARTLVTRGARSQLMSADALQRVASAIAGSSTLELAHAHHHVPLDAPQALARAISGFLSSR